MVRWTEAEYAALMRRRREAADDGLTADSPEVRQRVDQRLEAALQRDVEAWLTGHGYEPCDHKHLTAAPMRGRWMHIVKAKHNPIILDLLVMDNRTGQWVALELKTRRRGPTKEQRQLLGESRVAHLVRSMDDVTAVMLPWIARQDSAAAGTGLSLTTAEGLDLLAAALRYGELVDGDGPALVLPDPEPGALDAARRSLADQLGRLGALPEDWRPDVPGPGGLNDWTTWKDGV